MSQAALADAVNDIADTSWHQTTVAKIESGDRRVDIEEVFLLAAALDVSPMWLFLPDPKALVRVGRSWEFDRGAFVAWLKGDEALPEMDSLEFYIAKTRSLGIAVTTQGKEKR